MAAFFKWSGTGVLIFGSFINALGIYPFGVYVLTLGTFLWLIVGIIWKDKAMMITNTSMILLTILGMYLKLN